MLAIVIGTGGFVGTGPFGAVASASSANRRPSSDPATPVEAEIENIGVPHNPLAAE
jgi:hypothetical protein